MLSRLAGALAGALVLASAVAGAAAGEATVLVDAHLHYTAAQARELPPAAIVARLDDHGVVAGVVTGTPAELALRLEKAAPGRFMPLLGVYDEYADKESWHRDPDLPRRVERALDEAQWHGVGELHLFAEHRHSPVFHRIVALAAARDLPLLLHGDPAVVDALFAEHPEATVVWAHAGAYPCPALLRDYLARYPRLYADLSMRDARIAPEGRLDPQWEWLLMEHPERFMVGVDTFSTGRWRAYGRHAERIRAWLARLPPGVARQLARDTALDVYASRTRR